MNTKLQHIQNLRQIFQKSVESVRPHNLLSEANGYYLRPKLRSNAIIIQGKSFDLTNKRCHVVGFGKAVLGMAVQLEKQLQTHLSSGILSIPEKTLEQFRDVPEMQLKAESCFKIYEGAPNNQPDQIAMIAAHEIKALATSMTENDVLFVLISGGGSALLPLPKSTISLEEKMHIIRQLSNSGASIIEMNTVRIALSDIKGGKLAAAARNAHAVISFVISDIVGDPVDLIASGPTCTSVGPKRSSAREVLQKFNIWENLSMNLRESIEYSANETEIQPSRNNIIYVVGDNRVATATAVQSALEFGYNPFITSTTITGDLNTLIQTYTVFLKNIYRFRHNEINERELKKQFPFDSRIFHHFLKTLLMCEKTERPLLLIMAGEPTVKVTGCGLGGRNQELALRMSLEFCENPELGNICFLSAGTDGIDGPTSAAGAIGSNLVIEEYIQQQKTFDDLQQYILENDSYNFYKNLNNGKYHIVTGHTGTNVMDLHLLLLS